MESLVVGVGGERLQCDLTRAVNGRAVSLRCFAGPDDVFSCINLYHPRVFILEYSPPDMDELSVLHRICFASGKNALNQAISRTPYSYNGTLCNERLANG
jgi:hypothetical protein